jgi:hypothetical protein
MSIIHYNCNQQDPFGNVLVGRVEVGKAAFDAQQNEYLGSSSLSQRWKSFSVHQD